MESFLLPKAKAKTQPDSQDCLAGPAAITRNTSSISLRPGCCAQCVYKGGTHLHRWPGTAWDPSSRPIWTTQRWRGTALPLCRATGVPACSRLTGILFLRKLIRTNIF
eukprot:6201406-Amphidinium_carterae.1